MIERISQIIDGLKISVRSFEQQIGASNGLIRKAIANKTDIQSKWLAAIVEKYPQINVRWLLTGEGNMLQGERIQQVASDRSIVGGHGSTITGNVNISLPEKGYQKIIKSDGSETIVEVTSAGDESALHDLAAENATLREENKRLLNKVVSLQDRLLDGK